MPAKKDRTPDGECTEYETILAAQGYGISFANTATEEYRCGCADCVHAQDGSCEFSPDKPAAGAPPD